MFTSRAHPLPAQLRRHLVHQPPRCRTRLRVKSHGTASAAPSDFAAFQLVATAREQTATVAPSFTQRLRRRVRSPAPADAPMTSALTLQSGNPSACS